MHNNKYTCIDCLHYSGETCTLFKKPVKESDYCTVNFTFNNSSTICEITSNELQHELELMAKNIGKSINKSIKKLGKRSN